MSELKLRPPKEGKNPRAQAEAYATRANPRARTGMAGGRLNAGNPGVGRIGSIVRTWGPAVLDPYTEKTTHGRDPRAQAEAYATGRTYETYHGIVWTSTERTAGRSRTMGAQESPALEEA